MAEINLENLFRFKTWKGENEGGPQILLFHDFNDHVGRFSSKISLLQEISSEVIGVEYLPIHHETEKVVSHIFPSEVYRNHLRELINGIWKGLDSVVIMGVGVGALLASLTASEFGEKCDELVLMNPILDFDKILPGGIQQITRYVSGMSGNPTVMSWESRLLTKDADLLNELDEDDLFLQDSVTLNSVKNVKELGLELKKLMPKFSARLLLVCSEKSRLCDNERLFEMYSSVTEVEKHLLLIPGGDHYEVFRSNEKDIWEDVRQWLMAGQGDGSFFQIS